MKNNAVQKTVGFTDMLKYLLSVRDSIKYPLCIMLGNVTYDLLIKSGISKMILFDYMVSLVALPIVIVLSDIVPPHIKENYTFFTNPGIKRVLKVITFYALAYMAVLCVHNLANGVVSGFSYSQRVIFNVDPLERLALIAYEVGNSIKFLP